MVAFALLLDFGFCLGVGESQGEWIGLVPRVRVWIRCGFKVN